VTLKVNILSGTTTGGAVVLRTLGTGSLISNLGTLTSTASQRLDFIAGQTVSLTPPSRRTDSRDLYLDLSGISTWQPVQITIEKIHYNNGDEGIDTNSVKTLTIYK
jgi:hypothetical protein